MAKTIKFNLVCDGHQVRTLEDLRNNFNIDDILQYYHDKVLEKWLTVRGYTDELNHVMKITSSSPIEIIDSLVDIFNVEKDKNKIHYATSVIQYREDRILADKSKMNSQKASKAIYDTYFHEYEQLKEEILSNPKDKVTILAVLKEIKDQYAWLFSHDYRNFFYSIREASPLTVLCLLMNRFTREFFIFDGDLTSGDSQLMTQDIKEMYDWIKNFFSNVNDDLKERIGDSVVMKHNETGSRWVPLTSKKCLIIQLNQHAPSDNYECAVSSCSDIENFFKPDDINGKFRVMDGLHYQSKSDSNTLYYIEIE